MRLNHEQNQPGLCITGDIVASVDVSYLATFVDNDDSDLIPADENHTLVVVVDDDDIHKNN